MKRPRANRDAATQRTKPLRDHASAKKTKEPRRYKGHSLSRIESLPTEIVQHIFTFTANPNFPRSSPIITQKLSRRGIYDFHCRRLLCSFKSLTHPDPTPATEGAGTVENAKELAKAQTETLTCRWMTFDVFRQARKASLEHEYATRLRCVEATDTGEAAEKQDYLVKSNQHLELWLGPDCHIPRKLIRWPLSNEARGLLDALVMAGCEINWSNSLNGERALEAWAEAVSHRDYRMVHRLMSFGIMVRPTDNELEAVLESVDWEVPMLRLIATSVIFSNPTSMQSVVHFYQENYPTTFIRIMARHPHRTAEREQLMAFDNYSMVPIWQGSPRSPEAARHEGEIKAFKGLNSLQTARHRELGKWYPEDVSIHERYYEW